MGIAVQLSSIGMGLGFKLSGIGMALPAMGAGALYLLGGGRDVAGGLMWKIAKWSFNVVWFAVGGLNPLNILRRAVGF